MQTFDRLAEAVKTHWRGHKTLCRQNGGGTVSSAIPPPSFPICSSSSFSLPQPLIDPTNTPFTKYFCRNGYTHSIGSVTMTVTQYFTSSL